MVVEVEERVEIDKGMPEDNSQKNSSVWAQSLLIASLQFCVASYQAWFIRCNFLIWESVTLFLAKMPQDTKEELEEIIRED